MMDGSARESGVAGNEVKFEEKTGLSKSEFTFCISDAQPGCRIQNDFTR